MSKRTSSLLYTYKCTTHIDGPNKTRVAREMEDKASESKPKPKVNAAYLQK